MSVKTVFISYSHDSDEHKQRVLGLSERLRADGIETLLDQYVSGSPSEGWPRWMLNQLDLADSVLLICTETYYRRFRGHEKPNKGKGVDWEGALITQEIYYSQSTGVKFVPVLFSNNDERFIPEPLRVVNHYTLTTKDSYDNLYDSLLGQAGVEPGPVGELKKKPRAKGDALDFEESDEEIVELRRRLFESKGLRELRELLFRTQSLVSTPEVRLLITDIESAIAFARSALARTRAGFEAGGIRGSGGEGEPLIDISRIIKYAPELIGREADLKILSDAWQQVAGGEKKRPHILTFVALGGEGKTSLVANWTADLSHQNWFGCDAAFAWSFYSQGTSERTQASSDAFLSEGLKFFGDEETAASAKSSFEKGKRLAHLVGEQRALLILDGLEPLQYAPTSPTRSELKDQGLSALLKALATKSNGLCVVTTRYSIPDLRNFWRTTAPEIPLTPLANEVGVALLRGLNVKGTQKEFEQLVVDVKGHALTLNLLGSYLRDAHAGDIRKRDLVKLEEADAEEQSGHAFHVMDAYAKSFKDEGEKGIRALCVLRLLGLFDRPATADCLNAVWTGEEIGGLTEPLIGISEAQRNITLKRLEDARLITVNRAESSELVSLDAHPLLREYFAARVREQLSGAWRAAHQRLYQYLRDNTHEGEEPTLEDFQPLYQAVVHGCHGALEKETWDQIYFKRLLRGSFYSTKKLGAFGSDLAALTCFFDNAWSAVSESLDQATQALVFSDASLCLINLGRLREAVVPAQRADEFRSDKTKGRQTSSNLSDLYLALGEIKTAIVWGEETVRRADERKSINWHRDSRMVLAKALLCAGDVQGASARFKEAEESEIKRRQGCKILTSIGGVDFCDLLLAEPERAAWRGANTMHERTSGLIDACDKVLKRAQLALEYDKDQEFSGLTISLDQLTLSRSALCKSILSANPSWDHQSLLNDIDNAVNGLRLAGTQHHLPRGLLTRSWLRFIEGAETGGGSAQEDLDEAWEIAERGPMRLFMADIHLYRARLFHAVKPYPWNKNPDGTERGPNDDLKDARTLIEQCGYWRRKEELEDAEEAAKNW
ncbi:MAG TPA: SEFIR domain-containing protein [Pyrinomonadaceae bacterium]